MDATKSLVESRAFWGAFLALLAIIFKAFNLEQAFAWATDPTTVGNIMTIVGVLGTLSAIVFRWTATKQVTSVLPASTPPAVKSLAIFGLLFLGAGGLGGCAGSASQLAGDVGAVLGFTVTQSSIDVARSGYDAAFLAPAAHYRQLPLCAAGVSASLTNVCASRTVILILQADDNAVKAAFDQVSAMVRTGNNSGATAAFKTLWAAITAAEKVISDNNIK